MAGFLVDGDERAPATVLLAHGAGAPMDSPWMDAVAKALAAAGLRVVRFEFSYMAARRAGTRKPPPRADLLVPEYLEAVERLRAEAPLIIGGKSMGGRVASMVADEMYAARKTDGLLCLGYPFHPLGKPAKSRMGHLIDLKAPTLICQDTRDPFGTWEEVSGYELSQRIEILWVEDGDHDLKPRQRVSGITAAEHLRTLAVEVRAWTDHAFPADALAKVGYAAVWKGQRSWSGVAILSRGQNPVLTRTSLPGELQTTRAAISKPLSAACWSPRSMRPMATHSPDRNSTTSSRGSTAFASTRRSSGRAVHPSSWQATSTLLRLRPRHLPDDLMER